MQLFIFYILFGVAISLFIWITIRFKLTALSTFLLVLFLSPFFTDYQDWLWIEWVKRYSVIAGLGIVYFIQFLHESNAHKFKSIIKWLGLWITPFILLINILEPALLELFYYSYYNGIVGLILILTIPNFWGRWTFDKRHILGITKDWHWYILYTLWNGYLIYSLSGTVIFNLFIPLLLILCINLLACIIFNNWHIWAIIRINSLCICTLLDNFFPALFPPIYPVRSLPSYISIIWQGINVIFACYILWLTIKEKRRCFIFPRQSHPRRQ